GQVVNMSVGDFEAQMDDGFRAGGCQPAINDGHANDIASPWVPTDATHTWNLFVSAPGYQPAPIMDLSPYIDGTVCPLGDNAGCLIKVAFAPMSGNPAPTPTRSSGTTNTGAAVAAAPAPAPPATGPMMPSSPIMPISNRLGSGPVVAPALPPSGTGPVLPPPASPLFQLGPSGPSA